MLAQPTPDQRREGHRQPDRSATARSRGSPRAINSARDDDHPPRPEQLGQPVAGQPHQRHRQREDREGRGGERTGSRRHARAAGSPTTPSSRPRSAARRSARGTSGTARARAARSRPPPAAACGSSAISIRPNTTVRAAKIGCTISCWVRNETSACAKAPPISAPVTVPKLQNAWQRVISRRPEARSIWLALAFIATSIGGDGQAADEQRQPQRERVPRQRRADEGEQEDRAAPDRGRLQPESRGDPADGQKAEHRAGGQAEQAEGQRLQVEPERRLHVGDAREPHREPQRVEREDQLQGEKAVALGRHREPRDWCVARVARMPRRVQWADAVPKAARLLGGRLRAQERADQCMAATVLEDRPPECPEGGQGSSGKTGDSTPPSVG